MESTLLYHKSAVKCSRPVLISNGVVPHLSLSNRKLPPAPSCCCSLVFTPKAVAAAVQPQHKPPPYNCCFLSTLAGLDKLSQEPNRCPCNLKKGLRRCTIGKLFTTPIQFLFICGVRYQETNNGNWATNFPLTSGSSLTLHCKGKHNDNGEAAVRK